MMGEQWMVCTLTSARFGIISYNIFVMKLRKCGIDEWAVRWIEKCLTGRAQRAVISAAESHWRPTTSDVSQGSVLGPVLFNSSLTIWREIGFTLSKFANDTNGIQMLIGGVADTEEGCAAIQ